jgi:long-chain acyl-CoA synthetase
MTAVPSDIWRCFERCAERLPGETAIRFGDRAVSFRALATEVDLRAQRLAALGLRAGDLVAVSSRNPVAFTALVLALLKSSAAALLLSPTQGAHALRSIFHDVRVDWAVTDDRELATRLTSVAGRERAREFANMYAVARPAQVTQRTATATLAVVKLSSGSTAEPKAIAIDAAAVLAEAGAVSTTLGLGPGKNVLCPVPLHHSYGFDLGVLPMLTTGSSLTVHAPLVPSVVIRRLQDSRTSVFLGVPAMYSLLLETPLEASPDFSHIDYMLSCTAPLGVGLIQRFHTRFGVPICQHYGASEVGAVTTQVPAQVLFRPSSVGRPTAGVEIEIVEGEVVVSGPAVASGYLSGEPERSPFRNGRFHMGDNGSLDADGFLTLAGRRDALINVGGLKVSPNEVQVVLERHPAVREAAVVGRGDGSGNEFVYAAVAVRGDVTELELIRFCRGELEDFKVPRRVELRDKLPRLPSGKVDLRSTV